MVFPSISISLRFLNKRRLKWEFTESPEIASTNSCLIVRNLSRASSPLVMYRLTSKAKTTSLPGVRKPNAFTSKVGLGIPGTPEKIGGFGLRGSPPAGDREVVVEAPEEGGNSNGGWEDTGRDSEGLSRSSKSFTGLTFLATTFTEDVSLLDACESCSLAGSSSGELFSPHLIHPRPKAAAKQTRTKLTRTLNPSKTPEDFHPSFIRRSRHESNSSSETLYFSHCSALGTFRIIDSRTIRSFCSPVKLSAMSNQY